MAMSGLKPHHRIALGVSGGPDSMALCVLAANWKASALENTIIVDHGLRTESRDEAILVSRRESDLRLLVCEWLDGKPKQGHLQEAARDMRYQKFQEVCVRHGISALLVAHHADDQAELFILRLSRNSGVIGSCWDGISLHNCSPHHSLNLHGYAIIDLELLNPSKVAELCLSKFIALVLQFVSQRQRVVRGSSSKLLLDYIRSFPCKTSLTAAGCYLCAAPGSKGTKILERESVSPSNAEQLDPGKVYYFMKRFLVKFEWSSLVSSDLMLTEEKSSGKGIRIQKMQLGSATCVAGHDMTVCVRHMIDADWLYLSELSKCCDKEELQPQVVSSSHDGTKSKEKGSSNYARSSAHDHFSD
ncbi:unnamed protein product [Rhodiola kirilowii]